MSKRRLLSKIRKQGKRIARRFRLKYIDITTEHPLVRARYGSCDEDKVIRIRLHNLRDGKFLKYRNLVHTLCHELAHLKHMDHGKNFKQLNTKILEWARAQRIYNPHI